MYADDVTLYGDEEDFVSLENNVNTNIGILNNLSKINKLQIIKADFF